MRLGCKALSIVKGEAMLTKNYTYGNFTFKTFFKTVGQGWEVSLYCGNKPYFVGNFIHKKEAMMWWKMFNAEITSFATKYWCSDDTPQQWYCHFMSNHLYKSYYSYLDKVFNKYNKDFKKAYFKDVKKYNQMKKNFTTEDKQYFIARKTA